MYLTLKEYLQARRQENPMRFLLWPFSKSGMKWRKSPGDEEEVKQHEKGYLYGIDSYDPSDAYSR